MREIWTELSLIYMQFNNKTGYRNRKNIIQLIHKDDPVENREKVSKFKSLAGMNISFEHLYGCSYERGRARDLQTTILISSGVQILDGQGSRDSKGIPT